MSNPTGFLEDRPAATAIIAAPTERVRHWQEFVHPLEERGSRSRPSAAWIAAYRFATPAARSTI